MWAGPGTSCTRQLMSASCCWRATLGTPPPELGTLAGAAERRSPIGEYTVSKCYLVDRVFARLFAHPVVRY